MAGFPFAARQQCRVTNPYGVPNPAYASGRHDGVDLVCNAADKGILAVAAGTVIRSGVNPAWGEYVVTQLADGRALVYAHLRAGTRTVHLNQQVRVGQRLGVMGSTGHSHGAHLHLELQTCYYRSGRTQDICEFLGIVNQKGRVKTVSEKVAVEMTVPQAVQILVAHGVVKEPNHWLGSVDYVKSLDKLLINMAQALQKPSC